MASAERPTPGFTTLPVEIRLHIYSFILPEHMVLQIESFRSTPGTDEDFIVPYLDQLERERDHREPVTYPSQSVGLRRLTFTLKDETILLVNGQHSSVRDILSLVKISRLTYSEVSPLIFQMLVLQAKTAAEAVHLSRNHKDLARRITNIDVVVDNMWSPSDTHSSANTTSRWLKLLVRGYEGLKYLQCIISQPPSFGSSHQWSPEEILFFRGIVSESRLLHTVGWVFDKQSDRLKGYSFLARRKPHDSEDCSDNRPVSRSLWKEDVPRPKDGKSAQKQREEYFKGLDAAPRGRQREGEMRLGASSRSRSVSVDYVKVSI